MQAAAGSMQAAQNRLQSARVTAGPIRPRTAVARLWVSQQLVFLKAGFFLIRTRLGKVFPPDLGWAKPVICRGLRFEP
jgi:hypothetical protein